MVTSERTKVRRRASVRRFTVAMEASDYRRLCVLAETRRPRLSLQYVVNYAIQRFLEQADDPQLIMDFGNPIPRGSKK